MSFFRNVFINTYASLGKTSILKQQIKLLNQKNTEESKRLAKALSLAAHQDISSKELKDIARIEQLRKRLLLCREKITMIDYGAWNGSAHTKTEYTTTISRTALSSKNRYWASILYNIIRTFKPQYCIELGTNMGISASYQALALKHNGSGQLLTCEGAETRAALAKKYLEELDLHNTKVMVGRFQDTLPKILAENVIIDYAFIDGHHDEQATLHYFDIILRCCSNNAVIIFDDISWSEGMKRAWQKITSNPNIKISVDLFVMGICIIQKPNS